LAGFPGLAPRADFEPRWRLIFATLATIVNCE
jgi:hypothetical protein